MTPLPAETRDRDGRLEVLESAIEAANRLLENNYTDWGYAGGPNECEHGYAEGIPCRKCDEAIVRSAKPTPPPS